MKNTELRIGNLIQDVKHKSPWRIECFLGSSMATVDAGLVNFATDDLHDIALNEHEPIPITEEWLLKFGFVIEASREKIIFSNENFTKTINIFGGEDNDWGVQLIDKYKDKTETFVLQNGIQYIHELQNLYFAITGYELEIKN